MKREFLKGFQRGWESAVEKPNNSLYDSRYLKILNKGIITREPSQRSATNKLEVYAKDVGFVIGLIVSMKRHHPQEVLKRHHTYDSYTEALGRYQNLLDFVVGIKSI